MSRRPISEGEVDLTPDPAATAADHPWTREHWRFLRGHAYVCADASGNGFFVRRTSPDGPLIEANMLHGDKLRGAGLRQYAVDGQVMAEGLFWDDIPDGLWEFHYPDGKIALRTEYRDGVDHGKMEAFWENGHPSYTATLSDGKVDGPTKSWFQSGQIKYVDFLIRDQHQGYQIKYWENGRVREFAVFCLGRTVGPMIGYHENGELHFWTPTENGDRHGEAVLFDENGELQERVYWDHNKRVKALPTGAAAFPGKDNVRIPQDALDLR